MSVIFLFADGIGLGRKSGENPLAADGKYAGLERMSGGAAMTREAGRVEEKEHIFKGIDATLGVEGLPQSGTGQTTLFTGVNAAKKIGKHFGPFPHTGIKKYLKEQSLFRKALEKGKQPRFMNAYPDLFFKGAEKRGRWSCTTLMVISAGITLYTEEDVLQGNAVTAEISQRAWREKLNLNVPVIGEEDAARRVLKKAETADLVLYEYYLTDKAGHARDPKRAEEVLVRFDRFIHFILKRKQKRDTVVLTSDHGNVEDLSIKTHTLNNVPLAVMGPGVSAFEKVESIQGVTPALLEIL